MRMTDISASKRGHGLGCIEETFSQVNGNVTQPSRPAFDKLLHGPWYWNEPWKNIVFDWSNAKCLSDHAQIWPKQHIQGKNIVFPISQIYPYSCYHVLILSVCDVRVYILMSAVGANRVGAPARRAAPTADSLIPAAAPTHPLRDSFHSLTHWEAILWNLCKCLDWKTWVHCQRAGPSNGTLSATPEDREWWNIRFS